MKANRREIITGTAGISILGITQASAQATAPFPKIGIVSSIAYTGTAMSEAFERGLAQRAEIRLPVSHNLGYDKGQPDAMKMAIDTLNGETDVSLIVTMGGNITYEAARRWSTSKPFISLLGADPQPSSNRNFS